MIVRGLRDILLWLCATTFRLGVIFSIFLGNILIPPWEIAILIRDICD